MDLKNYDWPVVSTGEIAFSMEQAKQDLVDESKRLGYHKDSSIYKKTFQRLFFRGGKVIPKEGVDQEFYKNLFNYYQAISLSMEIDHDDKGAICALIASLIFDVEAMEKEYADV